jgi:hypothetical protein
MKVFLVSTPDASFQKMASVSARRLQDLAGLTPTIFRADSDPSARVNKMKLFLSFHEPLWYVDADWWLQRTVPFPEPSGPVVIAAPQDVPGFTVPELPFFEYEHAICCCVIGMDMGDPGCRTLIENALSYQASDGGRTYHGDEKHVNRAAQELMLDGKITVQRLPQRWNWCTGRPKDPFIVGLHAGFPNAVPAAKKLQWLEENTAELS